MLLQQSTVFTDDEFRCFGQFFNDALEVVDDEVELGNRCELFFERFELLGHPGKVLHGFCLAVFVHDVPGLFIEGFDGLVLKERIFEIVEAARFYIGVNALSFSQNFKIAFYRFNLCNDGLKLLAVGWPGVELMLPFFTLFLK